MKVYFIRHGKTLGNIEGRFIGRTNQPLEVIGVDELKKKKAPDVDSIYVSPLLRCIQTCEILYPNKSYTIIEELREMDFGDYENKTEAEIREDQTLKGFLKESGSIQFVNGESLEQFQQRCMAGFQQAIEEATQNGNNNVAFVVHGGTIMALLDGLSNPHKGYFQWGTHNGEGYVGELSKTDKGYTLSNILPRDYI